MVEFPNISAYGDGLAGRIGLLPRVLLGVPIRRPGAQALLPSSLTQDPAGVYVSDEGAKLCLRFVVCAVEELQGRRPHRPLGP